MYTLLDVGTVRLMPSVDGGTVEVSKTVKYFENVILYYKTTLYISSRYQISCAVVGELNTVPDVGSSRRTTESGMAKNWCFFKGGASLAEAHPILDDTCRKMIGPECTGRPWTVFSRNSRLQLQSCDTSCWITFTAL